MRQDRRILGYLGIVVSLLCCLPGACLTGFVAFASSAMSFDPTYQWGQYDTALSVGFWLVFGLCLLAGLALAGFGVWLLLKTPETFDLSSETP